MSNPNRRRIRKTKFKCGHRGFGGYCHLCRDLEKGIMVEHEGKYYHHEHVPKPEPTPEPPKEEKRKRRRGR